MKRLLSYSLIWLALLNVGIGEASVNDDSLKRINKENEKKIRLFEPLAQKGYKFSQCMLGFVYSDQYDFEKTLFWVEKLAKEGNRLAQAILGRAYLDKCLEDKDKDALKQGIHWLNLSLKQNCAFAQFMVGLMYYCGLGAPQDFQRAFSYYKQAAMQGFPKAQVELGKMFMMGEGVAIDEEQAFYWINQAAQTGLVLGAYYLGLCYRYGVGTKKDLKQAKRWFFIAAEAVDQGAIEALKSL